MGRDTWFDQMWQFIGPALPPAPASVMEIGCGRFGGFVPRLRAAGYDAVGVDPNAPEEAGYERVEFEQYRVPSPVGAVVACVSLHHVADLDVALDAIATAVAPGGTVAIIEWASERFDERTARWCFGHLAAISPSELEEKGTWLHHAREGFAESGLSWDGYLGAWKQEEGLHRGEQVVRGLDQRFSRVSCVTGPYFFAELDGVSFGDEQAAIDAGLLEPVGIRYVGRAR